MLVNVIGRKNTKLSIQQIELASAIFLSFMIDEKKFSKLNPFLTLNIKFPKNLTKNQKREKIMGLTECEDDYRYEKPVEFTITINPYMSVKQQMLALAHEMVHVKQFALGELDMDVSDCMVRYKKHHYDITSMSYFDQPWEIEAFGREFGLYERYMNFVREQNKKTKTQKRKLVGQLSKCLP